MTAAHTLTDSAHALASALSGCVRAGGVGTPPVTRGAKLQLVHVERSGFSVHWLRGVAHGVVWEQLADYLTRDVGLSDPVLCPGLWGYRKGLMFAEGVRLMWDPHSDTMPPCAIEARGEACEALGWERLSLLALPFELTRVDLAFDGHDLTPRRLWWSWQHKLARTKLKTPRWDNDGKHQTFTLGKVGSGTAQVQCYNRRGFNRLELRLFGVRAQAFQEAGGFVGGLLEARRVALGQLRSVIDFVDPQSDSNISRRALLPWWKAFVDGVLKARVQFPARVPASLASRRVFVRRIGKCLAHVAEFFGPAEIDEAIAWGRLGLGLSDQRPDIKRRGRSRPQSVPTRPLIERLALAAG